MSNQSNPNQSRKATRADLILSWIAGIGLMGFVLALVVWMIHSYPIDH